MLATTRSFRRSARRVRHDAIVTLCSATLSLAAVAALGACVDSTTEPTVRSASAQAARDVVLEPTSGSWARIVEGETAGATAFLLQRQVPTYGHCAITGDQVMQGFTALVGWIDTGVKPAA